MSDTRFSGDRALGWIHEQHALGIRAPGTRGHEDLVDRVDREAGRLGLRAVRQRWSVPLSLAPGEEAALTNVLVWIPGRQPGPPLLVCTHYDTRWIADNDPDPALRAQPIPGANDGGSGTAVQLELARVLAARPPRRDVVLGFMDGEDLGDIEGHPFAAGSHHLVRHREELGLDPAQVIALDMVGGEGMRLNLEANSLMAGDEGRDLFLELFRLGRSLGLAPFSGDHVHSIYSDHGPWLEAGYPAVLLIDIEYPQWHTHADLPGRCSAASLEAVGRVLELFLG